MEFLNVGNIAFTVIGYPMSYVEFVGTIFYLWSVWLISKRQTLTWPIGIISVLLYLVMFYQIRLYADAFEQIYYLIASIYGWWTWNQSTQSQDGLVAVRFSSSRNIIWILIGTIVVGVLTGVGLTRAHLWFPIVFPEPASFPYLDALTTIASFTAMWLMAQKRIESWVYWIVVDVVGIGLYFVKDVRFVALLYVILLVLAINGLRTWLDAKSKPALTV